MSDAVKKQLDDVLAGRPGEELPDELLSRIVGGQDSINAQIGTGGDGHNQNHHLNDGPYSKAWGREF